MKKIISLILVFAVCFTISGQALALQVSEQSPEKYESVSAFLDGEWITYNCYVENGEVVRIEFDGNVLERRGNEFFLNGEKYGSVTVTPITDEKVQFNAIEPRTGWIWSESGNRSDYENIGETKIIDVYVEQKLKWVPVTVLAGLFLSALGIQVDSKALQLAGATIDGLSAFAGLFDNSEHVYCIQDTYDHKYLPLNKMVDRTLYYNSSLTTKVPNGYSRLFGVWS